MEKQTRTDSDVDKLFTQYLNVSNTALGKHRNKTPYKQIIETGERILGDKKMGVGVYSSDPASPHDFYTIEMKNGNLHLVSKGKKSPDLTYKVSRDYLQKVVDNQDEYIDHPAKLDWDWLKSRLGLS